jgi:acyl-CoA reductase-like NAD-dependent aldehyde dehydrogenase
MSTERIVVHTSVASEFRQKLKALMSENNGPALVLINSTSVEKSKTLIRSAVKDGARLLAGDVDTEEMNGTHLRPIVVDGVTRDMELYHQETFGPSVSIVVVDSEEEAIAVANDTEYGLTGAVFTENLATGFRVAKKIHAGAVHINSMTVHDEVALPHGGMKRSGFGRFNADSGIEEFLTTKTLTWQH